MSETALYRKYRPKNFKEVIGQEHIVNALEGALKLGNIAHAYLFSGSRGTGKTSVARIFAKALGVTENDIYEIDGASNRGINEIRALRDAVSTLPLESPYKIYIIDEAHMLTKEAFNALLKTLEEPPKHVIFIMATTEADKFPETIISRCQSFSFKKPTREILKKIISQIAKKEGFEIEESASELIALLGDGSFRDAQGILQKAISVSGGKKITVGQIETVSGAPKGELVNSLLKAIDEKSLEKALEIVRKVSEQNTDGKIFMELFLAKFRFALLLRASPKYAELIRAESGEETFALLKSFADKKDTLINSKTLLTLLEASSKIKASFIPELPLELALMDILGQNVG